MSRIAYVNGHYGPLSEASVHIEDRGYQFSDGIYEVVALRNGRLSNEEGHLDRLERSLKELRIAMPMHRRALQHVMRELARKNGAKNALIYIQVTRGVARRDHPFPKDVAPSIVLTCRSLPKPSAKALAEGVAVISQPDIRWGRRDIKSISLLPNILAKQAAREAGAYEAWLVETDGTVTEGSSTNAWILTADGVLVTRPRSTSILPGITRGQVLKLAQEAQIRLEERTFTLEEAKNAREAFMSSASALVLPITKIDGQPVGDGIPGPLAKRLRELYEIHLAS